PLCCRTSHAHPRATLFPYTTLFRSFLGFIPDETLPSYYHAADVFVLPTRELEGFGLVTVEALACGTPVLGTPVGATPEVLSGLDASLVFRGISAEIMAEDLLRFLETLARA